ncbi:Major facilitator superfamily domain general substrate transporter [Penicillium expansum]|nr:Major facilitator superfamily domain general substrate transporter [Penicillium expansum]
MQSILQHRRIRQKIEQQFVTKHEKPRDVWTHEGRYDYHEGEIHTQPREEGDDLAAERRREHGHRTFISGPALHPRHTARSHLEREGDIEGAEVDPEISTDPHTINAEETLGNTADIMVTGVERPWPPDHATDSETDVESVKRNKIIIVTFEGDCDKMDPHNWSLRRRILTTILTSLTGFVIFWSSTIDATAFTSTKKLFHTSSEVQSLPTAMFLIGTGIGALITGPISEVFGRNPVVKSNSGTANSLPRPSWTLRICPGGLSAASLVDIWSRIERVYTFPAFSIIIFTGALVGPIPGSFAVHAHSVSWRWVDWMTIILSGLILIPVVLFLPETYSPILLFWKAKELRRLTGDDRYRSPLEFRKATFTKRMRSSLYRPISLFLTEPIIMIHSVSLSLLFMILYTFIAGYVSIYEVANHFTQTSTALAFLGIEVGVVLSALTVPLSMWLLRREIYRSRERGQNRPDPEISLYMSMFGAPAVPISLFWMGWTAKLQISFWSPLVASVFYGFGTLCLFVSGYQYVADAYESHAASALSCLQMSRLVAAGIMRIIAETMYKKLGVSWTLTLLGGISLIFLPVPYLLYWKGHKIRSRSRYARRNE